MLFVIAVYILSSAKAGMVCGVKHYIDKQAVDTTLGDKVPNPLPVGD